jgi:type I site-specific restriction-modification system R (restriction) subunit
MFEKVLKRKGSAEGATKNDKVKQHDTAAEPQAAQPMMEGVPTSGAALAVEGNVEAAVAETEVGDLRAYAPAIASEPTQPELAVEPGDDMREIMEGYAEADRQAEEEEATTASTTEEYAGTPASAAKEDEAVDETDVGPEVEKEVVAAFREAVRKSDDAREEASNTALDKFFNGDLSNLNKHTSFKRACKELKREITPQTLSSWIRAADNRRRQRAQGKVLAAVEDEEKRMALGEEINQSRISIRDLRKRVREINAKEAPDKDLKRVMRKLKDQFSLPGGKEFEDLVSDPDKLEKDLSKTERKGLRKGIAARRGNTSKLA